MASEKDPESNKRLFDLLDYIEQVEKLNRDPAFTMPTEFFRGLEADLRGLSGVEFDVLNEGDEIWMRIPRLKEMPPPGPSPSLVPWMALSASPDTEPTLRAEISIPAKAAGEQATLRRLEEHPEIEPMFLAYKAGAWSGWANSERPRRKTIALYNRLFLLEQSLEAEGAETALELVWGIGVATWAHRSGRKLLHPILTRLVEMSLDPGSLALEIRPRDRPPFLELDPYSALDIGGVLQLEAAWKNHLSKAEKTISPFDRGSFTDVLKLSVGFLDPAGRYWPDEKETLEDRDIPAATDALTITDTWALFARKRSTNFLVQDLARLKKELESGAEVPGGPAALVSELSSEVATEAEVFFRGLSYGGREPPPGTTALELYFPKPYNEEQVSIVQKLENSDGVVVQGPPGTGKTHTIANVISHYLANGKSVLVTSKGEPALSVLREQVPEPIRALTVALLTDEKDGMRQFEHAIQTIASNVARLDTRQIERDIQATSNHVNGLHAKLADIDNKITKWASYHTKPIRLNEREWTAQHLAQFVVQHADRFAWFVDKLSAKPQQLLFSSTDIAAVRQARSVVGADLSYLPAVLPVADSFPDGRGMAALHDDLIRAKAMTTAMSEDGLAPLLDAKQETIQKATLLLRLVQETLELRAKVHKAGHRYTSSLETRLREERDATLASLYQLLDVINKVDQERQFFLSRPVVVHTAAELDEPFGEAVSRASQGKAPLGFLGVVRRELRVKVDAVAVSGLPPRDEHDWGHVNAYLDFARRSLALAAQWNALAAEHRIPQVDVVAVECVKSLATHAIHITDLKRLCRHNELQIKKLAGEVFGEGHSSSETGRTEESLKALQDALSRHLSRSRLAYASAAVSDLLAKLGGKSGAVVDRARAFVTQVLGSPAASAAGVADNWNQILAELRRLSSLRGHFAEILRVGDLVERSGAPRWAHQLRTDSSLATSDKWTSADWLEAWTWAHAVAYLEAIDGRQVLKGLQSARKEAETDLSAAYQTLVEKKTWLAVHRNSPPAVKAALQAYLNAVKHIGKGTGIRAVRYRKEAREAMVNAYRAVPCWIMPQWRASETLPPEVGKFDLVIVDEASQSDLWALPCLLRGKKLMIVGDDRQVSPDGIGLREDKIIELKKRFLKDQVHGAQMTPEKSLYDLAKVVFFRPNGGDVTRTLPMCCANYRVFETRVL